MDYITVVETPEFVSRADTLMADDNRDELVAYLASNPTAGDLIPGTGGVRKLRWRLGERGKRGGRILRCSFSRCSRRTNDRI